MSSIAGQQESKESSRPEKGKQRLERQLKAAVWLLVGGLAPAMAAFGAWALLTWGPANELLGGASGTLGSVVKPEQLLLLGAGILVLTLSALILLRLRAKRRPMYRIGSGCPQCGSPVLLSTHRRRSEKVAGALLFLPLRRFACRGCSWEGVLLDARRRARAGAKAAPAAQAAQLKGRERADGRMSQVASAQRPAPRSTGALLTVDGKPIPRKGSETENLAAQQGRPVLPDDVVAIRQSLRGVEAVPPELRKLRITSANGEKKEVVLRPLPKKEPEAANGSERRGAPAPGVEKLEAAEPEEAAAEATKAIEPDLPRARVIAPVGAKLRRKPRGDAEVLQVLPAGSVVGLLQKGADGEQTAWRQVYAEGTTGWVAAAFIKPLRDGRAANGGQGVRHV